MLLCNAATGNLVQSWTHLVGSGVSFSCLALGPSQTCTTGPQPTQQLVAVASQWQCSVMTAPWRSGADPAAAPHTDCNLLSTYFVPQVSPVHGLVLKPCWLGCRSSFLSCPPPVSRTQFQLADLYCWPRVPAMQRNQIITVLTSSGVV